MNKYYLKNLAVSEKDPVLLLQADLQGYEVPEGGISLDLPHFDVEGTNLEIVPVSTEEGKGIGIDTELGDFLEYESDGVSDLDSWFGTRGTVEPNEDPENLF